VQAGRGRKHGAGHCDSGLPAVGALHRQAALCALSVYVAKDAHTLTRIERIAQCSVAGARQEKDKVQVVSVCVRECAGCECACASTRRTPQALGVDVGNSPQHRRQCLWFDTHDVPTHAHSPPPDTARCPIDVRTPTRPAKALKLSLRNLELGTWLSRNNVELGTCTTLQCAETHVQTKPPT
jgi:hypothetical protein